MRELVSINGQITAPEDAKITVFDRGFLYGDSIYEVARSYNRVFFALEDHIERLYKSAERIGMELERSKSQMIEEIYAIYDKSEINDAYMRIVITRGGGRINLDPTSSPGNNTVVFITEIPKIDPAIYREGVGLATATVLRNSRRAMDPNIKSGNYLNNIMALGEARKRGAADAIMTNREGYVTEGTTSNIFMVKDNQVISTPDEGDILHGITRKTLKKICNDNKVTWVERFFTPDELKKSDEAFSTGSVKEIVPVSSVDGTKVGKAIPGPLTSRLSELYKGFIKDYCQSFQR